MEDGVYVTAEASGVKKMSLNLHRFALAVPSDLCAALGESSHLGIQTEADPEHPPGQMCPRGRDKQTPERDSSESQINK